MKQAGTYDIFPTSIINEMSNTFKNLSYEDVSSTPTRTQSSGAAGALSSLVENIQTLYLQPLLQPPRQELGHSLQHLKVTLILSPWLDLI